MNTEQTMSPQQICEKILREEKRYNKEHRILPSENAVADRLLDRSIEMNHVYDELHGKLHAHPPALQIFLGLLLSTAAFWNPDKIQEARNAREDLSDTNRHIATKASELAELLERRSELHNTTGFSSDTHYAVCGVVEAASQHNHLFKFYVQDRLRALRGQFDLKYWPTLSEFVEELALNAKNATTNATDPLTADATVAARSSKADFFKALFAAIEENGAENYGQLPLDFKLTDRAIASLGNCALNLGPDDLIDEAYIKRFRQRERSRAEPHAPS